MKYNFPKKLLKNLISIYIIILTYLFLHLQTYFNYMPMKYSKLLLKDKTRVYTTEVRETQ